MIINGIIAEYNPFHNGHRYQLKDARQATNADYTVVVMSGNFVQRGAPALLNKYRRAEMALRNGADLILELPMYYATSSAEYFAMGAVTLLDKLQVVNHLCFGSECGDIAALQKIAKILAEEPVGYAEALRHHLKKGLSYPAARIQALQEYEPSLWECSNILASPNNILGTEYLKALYHRNSSMKPYTTIRAGAGYHDTTICSLQENNIIHDNASVPVTQCSALAIRQAINANPAIGDIPLTQNTKLLQLQNHIPVNVYSVLTECLVKHTFLHCNDFSTILHYKLLMEQNDGYTRYLDVSPELSDRIRNHLYRFESFTGFCDLLKTKDMTYTRISRCLLHVLLGITSEIMTQYCTADYTPYARVLGFRKDATPLLSAIKRHSSIPLVTKLADAEQTLSTDAISMLKRDIHMNSVYESIMSQKSGKPMLNEYRTPIVIV